MIFFYSVLEIKAPKYLPFVYFVIYTKSIKNNKFFKLFLIIPNNFENIKIINFGILKLFNMED